MTALTHLSSFLRTPVGVLSLCVLSSPYINAQVPPSVDPQAIPVPGTPPATAGPTVVAVATKPDPAVVLKVMRSVADWQLALGPKSQRVDWVSAVGDTGITALAPMTGDETYYKAMIALGQKNHWKLGKQPYFADDQCIAQVYIELYLHDPKPEYIAAAQARFDAMVARPYNDDLTNHAAYKERWSWCDSLYMGPPAYLRLTQATGDAKYLDFADKHWWGTYTYLYDKDEHLIYRDDTFFEKSTPSGKKVFWARGNGWVMGSFVRMLEFLPKDHPDRAKYIAAFREMAAKIVTLQQPDGGWTPSLLDPASIPTSEVSGSGLFTYAFAWGVNNDVLDRATFEPAALKGWAFLSSKVDADGKLNAVQQQGAAPVAFKPDSTAAYGVGAFLLAGSEIYRLAGGPMPVASHP